MLILTRKVSEGIIIGDNITIKILDNTKGSVKIGIEAPKETLILREELKDAIKDANVKASEDTPIELLGELGKRIGK
jgi:carbon storage regulator